MQTRRIERFGGSWEGLLTIAMLSFFGEQLARDLQREGWSGRAAQRRVLQVPSGNWPAIGSVA